MHLVPSVLVAPPQNKGFLDRLADAAANVLMGESEQSPASKYALICQRCFAHNGLVLKDEVMDIRQFSRNDKAHLEITLIATRMGQSSCVRNAGVLIHLDEHA